MAKIYIIQSYKHENIPYFMQNHVIHSYTKKTNITINVFTVYTPTKRIELSV